MKCELYYLPIKKHHSQCHNFTMHIKKTSKKWTRRSNKQISQPSLASSSTQRFHFQIQVYFIPSSPRPTASKKFTNYSSATLSRFKLTCHHTVPKHSRTGVLKKLTHFNDRWKILGVLEPTERPLRSLQTTLTECTSLRTKSTINLQKSGLNSTRQLSHAVLQLHSGYLYSIL